MGCGAVAVSPLQIRLLEQLWLHVLHVLFLQTWTNDWGLQGCKLSNSLTPHGYTDVCPVLCPGGLCQHYPPRTWLDTMTSLVLLASANLFPILPYTENTSQWVTSTRISCQGLPLRNLAWRRSISISWPRLIFQWCWLLFLHQEGPSNRKW